MAVGAVIDFLLDVDLKQNIQIHIPHLSLLTHFDTAIILMQSRHWIALAGCLNQ